MRLITKGLSAFLGTAPAFGPIHCLGAELRDRAAQYDHTGGGGDGWHKRGAAAGCDGLDPRQPRFADTI